MFQQIKIKNVDGINLKDSIYLSEEEYASVNKAIIEAPEQALSLLDLFPVEMVSATQKFYKYTTLTKYGSAGIVRRPSDFPALTLDGSKASVELPMKGISFNLDKDDIANSKLLGQKLDILHARIAGDRVKKLQDECLYNKSSAFGTLGVYGQGTGAFSGTNWSTSTTDVFDQIRLWMKSVPAAYAQEDMRLILHRDQYSELFRSTWNNGSTNEQVSGGTFMAKIKAAWPRLKIVQSQWVTTAYGVLFPFNQNVLRRVISISTRAIDWDENPMEYIGAAIGRDLLVVPAPSAVVIGSSL